MLFRSRDMLDFSQHGGIPGRSTLRPTRVVAEIFEDSQQTGQELHFWSADLSKAFDTLE